MTHEVEFADAFLTLEEYCNRNTTGIYIIRIPNDKESFNPVKVGDVLKIVNSHFEANLRIIGLASYEELLEDITRLTGSIEFTDPYDPNKHAYLKCIGD